MRWGDLWPSLLLAIDRNLARCSHFVFEQNADNAMRAHTPAGILLKMRVGEEWAMVDDWGQDEET